MEQSGHFFEEKCGLILKISKKIIELKKVFGLQNWCGNLISDFGKLKS